MSRKLRLPDVTVCAADCLHPDLAARALERSVAGIDFGDAILFSDREVKGAFRWRPIAPLKSTQDYSRFCLRDMAAQTATPFVLVVQWDGYVVDPDAWSRSFLSYDYIGAPWSRDGVVGNGGFSLRSRKLLGALQSVPVLPGYPEDWLICRLARDALERQHAIRFAPKDLASRFSFEELPPAKPTFGFHGVFNLRNYETDEGLISIASSLTAREHASWQYFHLIFDCLQVGRTDVAVGLYEFSRRDMPIDRMKAMASKGPITANTIAAGVDRLESLLAARGTVA